MKKLYFLSLMLLATITSFGQTIYSENFGTPAATTLIPAYITGTAPATFQNASTIVYSGTADVRISLPSSTYSGASGGGNIFFTTTAPARVFQIDGINTSSYTSANIQMTFGINVSPVTSLPILEYSTNASAGTPTWTPITIASPAATGWSLVSIAGGILPASTTLSLRFTQPTVQTGMRIDDVRVFNFNPACTLVIGTATSACNAVTSGIDTYTATIPYTGGGTGTYTITASSGTVAGANPGTTAAGNILINGVTEGVAVTVSIVNGTCSYPVIIPVANCKIVNAFPFYEGFNYTAGAALGNSQMWATVNAGDDIVAQTGSLIYTGSPAVTSTGNAVTFSGTGAEAFTPFTPTTTGTLYTSFLLNVSDITNVTTDLSSTYFASLTDASSGNYKARIFVKKNGTQYQLGLENAGTVVTALNTDAILRNVGDVVRVVVAFDFASNALSLWVNPTNGAAPNVSFNPATGAITTLAGFVLRQDSATLTPTIIFDELRISTNLSDLGLTSLATEKYNEIAGLKVYTNNGSLYILSDGGLNKTVAIYDILGKQIIKTEVIDNQTINISPFNKGIYVVKVEEDGKIATKKLIIQ
jgi:hypothetical protein